MLNTAYNMSLIGRVNTKLPQDFINHVTNRLRALVQVTTATPLNYILEASDRYSGLDLDYYRTAMTTQEFRAYIDFIGEDSFEIDYQPDDFKMYYPEDED